MHGWLSRTVSRKLSSSVTFGRSAHSAHKQLLQVMSTNPALTNGIPWMLSSGDSNSYRAFNSSRCSVACGAISRQQSDAIRRRQRRENFWDLARLGQSQSSTGTPGSRCGAEPRQPREDFPHNDVRRVAANQEMQMHALENTAYLKEQGWRALNHQPVAFP